MDCPEVLDSLGRKVREDTLVSLVCPLHLLHHCIWRRETLETLEVVAYLDSQDPEVIRVCQAYLVVREYLGFLVLLSRVKDCQDSLVTLGNQELQDSLDQREKLESWDSQARLDQWVKVVHPVSLATLEKMVDLVTKV